MKHTWENNRSITKLDEIDERGRLFSGNVTVLWGYGKCSRVIGKLMLKQ